MIKKLIIISFSLLFLSFFSFKITKATNQCHFYINDVYESSTTIPFYLYETTKYTDPNSMPITKYKASYTYIDSVTKCEEIEKQIILKSYSSTTYSYYSYIQTNTNTSLFFGNSLLNKEGALKAYATISDKLPPVFNGYKEEYQTDIDNPIPLDTILKSITALDESDGDITSNIEIIYENYSTNMNKLGYYVVMLTVNDSLNNKATLTFHIEIKDTSAPTIEGVDNYISYLSSPINISEIKSNLHVYDNYYKNLEQELYICEDNYSENKLKTGIYNVFFCLSDLSNNNSTPFKTTIEVKDDIKPIIEGLNNYTTSISSPISVKEIMYSLAASDSNKDISSNIYILDDYYSTYQNTLGEKHIFFEVSDDYGNISEPFKVTINLIDDISPTIFGLNMFTSYLSHPYSLSHIKQQLTALDNFDGDITHLLEVIEDTYTPNINNKGTYYLTLQVKDSSNNKSDAFKITIETIDDVAPTINGKRELEYELKNKPTIQQIILDNYTVIDNIDSNLKIEIVNDNYTDSLTTGTYYVELTCTDSSNNFCPPFQSKINIVETIINIKSSLLYLPTSSLFSQEEIRNLINLSQNASLLEDSYTANYSTEGNYTIKYKLDDSSFIEISIKTFTPTCNEPQKKETFLTKVKRFFLSIINFFKNIFNCINYSNIYQDYLQ